MKMFMEDERSIEEIRVDIKRLHEEERASYKEALEVEPDDPAYFEMWFDHSLVASHLHQARAELRRRRQNVESFRAPCGAAGLYDMEHAHVVQAYCKQCEEECEECPYYAKDCQYMAILDVIQAAHGHVCWETKVGWEEAEDAIVER